MLVAEREPQTLKCAADFKGLTARSRAFPRFPFPVSALRKSSLSLLTVTVESYFIALTRTPRRDL